jgi:polysaccharide export outer membrane protein
MDPRPTTRRWRSAVLAGLIALSGGCFHTKGAIVAPPPDGAVPTELNPVILPRYVIAPPDILFVQVLQPPYIHYLPKRGEEDARAADAGKPILPIDTRSYFSDPLTPQPIEGQHTVQMDGTIDLGIYGSVQVAGLTTDQARERVREFILQQTDRKPGSIQVRVSVLAFNSKQYYVITDGAGYGEQVAAFPVTGSETVLDAIARIGGLPQVSSKRDIWVARRSPHGGLDQILPVCWEDITQKGITATNYQVLPGDRIYVQSQRIISLDNALAKILQPIQRVFGVILLGSETVNSINGRTAGTTQ